MCGVFIRPGVPASIWRPLESREHNVIRNYDYYSTRYNYDHSNEEVLLWYQEFGFDNVRIGKLPVTMSGEKIPKAIEPIRVSYYPPDAGLWKDYEAIGIEREPIEYSAVQKAVPRI